MVQSVHRWNSVSKTDLIWFAANTIPVPSVMEHVQRRSPSSGCLYFIAVRCLFHVLAWVSHTRTPNAKACCLNPQDYILCNLVFLYIINFHYSFLFKAVYCWSLLQTWFSCRL